MDLVVTDIQIIIMGICAVLSLISYRCRIPSLAIVPAIGLFIVGFQLYDASRDPLILALFFVLAIVQFTISFRKG